MQTHNGMKKKQKRSSTWTSDTLRLDLHIGQSDTLGASITALLVVPQSNMIGIDIVTLLILDYIALTLPSGFNFSLMK